MVPGKGPVPAVSMIVGEAPGRQEVEAGEPFVGSAGRLLDAALRSLDIPRESLYITNVVKNLPLDEDNKIRRPNAGEIQYWSSSLEWEIQHASPESILLLGRTAVDEITGYDQAPFGASFQAIKWGGKAKLYTAWHPSFLLHRGISPESQYHDDKELWFFWLEQLQPWAEGVLNDLSV